ncbi:hypothetical protein DW194_10185 [Subdoligranulum sp. AM16-9]|nr:hypothetical protein DW194_10185 [Subdoligranulum sp. AM16-9]
MCCAAGFRFPSVLFSGAQKGNFAHFAHKIALLYGRGICPPGARPGGQTFFIFFDRPGRAPFQVPAFFAFGRLHADKTPANVSFARPCGETLRFPKKIRPETCFDTVKNGSTAKTFTEKGLIFTGAPLIIETEVGQSG